MYLYTGFAFVWLFTLTQAYEKLETSKDCSNCDSYVISPEASSSLRFLNQQLAIFQRSAVSVFSLSVFPQNHGSLASKVVFDTGSGHFIVPSKKCEAWSNEHYR